MYEAASSDPRKPSAPATGFPVSYSTSTTEAEVYSYSYGPVVVPVPPPHPKPIVEWSTGLCDCFSDWGNFSSSANKGELNVLGWHGNVEQRSRGVAMTVATAPPVEQGMNR
ncbi:hypothetical protein JHK82_013823 [Glycine max]|nr:hypothetical protein JHK86_013836 [Glycine max]KAG5155854.1 hypothetical protein JHK82_013823 [Glycine max]